MSLPYLLHWPWAVRSRATCPFMASLEQTRKTCVSRRHPPAAPRAPRRRATLSPPGRTWLTGDPPQGQRFPAESAQVGLLRKRKLGLYSPSICTRGSSHQPFPETGRSPESRGGSHTHTHTQSCFASVMRVTSHTCVTAHHSPTKELGRCLRRLQWQLRAVGSRRGRSHTVCELGVGGLGVLLWPQ